MRSITLFSVLLMTASSQTAVSATSGSWTALDGTWRWHAGDNPQWASATFDDSHWSPLPVPGMLLLVSGDARQDTITRSFSPW